MKTKSIIFALLACFTIGGFSSCEDMLDAESERHSYETATDTLYSYWGIIRTLQNLGERYVILGEVRGDLVSPTEYVSDTIAAIADFDNPQDGDCRYLRASDFYAVINNCNAYLAAADTVRPIYGANAGMKYMMREYAQVWAIRAWTYMQLVQLYDKVPFYTKPLTSLAEVEDFYNNGNCVRVDRYTLAEEIEKEAGSQLANILNQDLPSYGTYGMVHSKFCFFPVKAVMGDLWLLAAQSKAQYEKAAQYYYEYLQETSSTLPTGYSCSVSSFMHSLSGEEELVYYPGGQASIFREATSAPTAYDEAITVIPSTTNRQWGIVQTGVNDVFGFTTSLTVTSNSKGDGNDTIVTSASVNLSLNPEPQCTGSKAFVALTRAYPTFYVKAIETDANNREYIKYDTLTTKVDGVETAAPDARRAWLESETFLYNGNRTSRDYIEKQNPNGVYTTGFPVIYRKAGIWLRFAEAINRAGYPEYAFAILADGLDEDYMPRLVSATSTEASDYHVDMAVLRDTLGNRSLAPNNMLEYFQEMYDEDPALYADAPSILPFTLYAEDLEDEDLLWLLGQGDGAYVQHNTSAAYSIKSKVYAGKLTTGMYIPLNQAAKAANVPFLRFDDANFAYKVTLSSGGNNYAYGISHGVHDRGCTMLSIAADTLCPYYNFEKCVKSKWPDFKPVNYYSVSKGEYDAYQERLIDAVEELIVDEMGLELCFEGNRFNDLVRVAERRSPEWLAKKVAARTTGKWEGNPQLYGKLTNKANWYFKLPTY